MEIKENGWCIVSINHPATGSTYIVNNSFRWLRQDAIRDFVKGTSFSWDYFKKKYNFRCVKAEQTIKACL